TQTLILAAREAMTNAAKHSGVDEVAVFLDADGDPISLYVRDRGTGFDPDAVASDRRGVAESIRGRMGRVGGTARVVSWPAEGTGTQLPVPRGELYWWTISFCSAPGCARASTRRSRSWARRAPSRRRCR